MNDKNIAEVLCELHPDPILIFAQRDNVKPGKLQSLLQDVQDAAEMQVFCVTAAVPSCLVSAIPQQ
jgi:hypothetical protein